MESVRRVSEVYAAVSGFGGLLVRVGGEQALSISSIAVAEMYNCGLAEI
jgi:hypothetical protein